MPCIVRIEDLIQKTDNPADPCYFPDYPTDPDILSGEIEELIELASLRDDPEALANPTSENRRRLAISPFLQLRPQPLGAVFNRERSEDEQIDGRQRLQRKPGSEPYRVCDTRLPERLVERI